MPAIRAQFRVLATVVLLSGWNVGPLGNSPDVLVRRVAAPAEPPVQPSPASGRGQRITGDEVPAGLSASEWGQIKGALEESSYHASRVEKPGQEPALVAANRAQRYRTTFRSSGIEIASQPVLGKDWRLAVAVTGFGYEGAVRPLPVAEPVAEGARVEYRRGQVTEWYENRPGGLEQGFTIAEAPGGTAGGPLAFELAVEGGLEVTIEGDCAVFADSAGRIVVRYAGLKAWDADGRALGSRLEGGEEELRLLVEAGQARFPVMVDPLFVQEAKLLGNTDPDGEAFDSFGVSVAVSGDTAVVGAHAADVGTNGDQGSAYVFVRSGTVWSAQQKLTAPDGWAGDSFGISVAVSGDTAVVGADAADLGPNTDRGAAYVFVRSGTVWSAQEKLTTLDGQANDRFGVSVAVSGDTAVVGANSDDLGAGWDQGSAYVFVRSGTVWSVPQKLTAPDGEPNDAFGTSVAVSGDTAVVGAPGDDVGTSANQGSAHVFVRSGAVWSAQQKLTASDGGADDVFGGSVAVSGDSVVVGAYLDDAGANTDQGSAYVFVRSGVTWSEQQKLTAADGGAGDSFGSRVAVSGDTAVVGAYSDDVGTNTDQGSAYVFVRSGVTWSEQQKLTATDGAADDLFGGFVAVSGDSALMGASFDDVGTNLNQGSAYAFARSGMVWGAPQKLTATDGAASSSFGGSVAVSGDTAVVGAAGYDAGPNTNQGAAYVFVRSGAAWSAQQKLMASDGAAADSFGTSVAVSGETVVVGAPGDDLGANMDQGSAYVFVRSGVTWSEQQKLTATDGGADDSFGSRVAVSADTAVVGADGHDVGPGTDQGAAYVFVRSGAVWSAQQKLTASDGAAGDLFGVSVAVAGETAVVGADGVDLGASANQGAAYVFVRSGVAWSEQQKLTAADGAAGDLFGVSVAVSSDTAVVGAAGYDTGLNTNQGAAYAFVRSGGTWSEQQKLTATDAEAGDLFGNSVAVSGDTAVVGAAFDDVGAADRGSAYVFVRSGTTWSEHVKLTASDGGLNDSFAFSVAISGDTAVAGAPGDDIAVNVDQGSAYVFHEPRADLNVAKADGVSATPPGGAVTYTITASNAGPVAATGVTVADAFPAALTCSTTCAGSGGAACTAGPFPGSISDSVDLPVGGTVTYLSTCTLSMAATGTLTNTATITAPASVRDPYLANNTATDVDVIGTPAGSLTATAQSPSSVLVKWTDPNAGETAFRVERSTDGTTFTPVQTVGANVTSHLDSSGLTPATLYHYRVIAVTPPGDVPSNVATATTFPATAARVCATQVSPYHSWARGIEVARTGTQWVAAWSDRKGNANEEIYVHGLDANGAPAATATRITTDDMLSRYPTLTWNGSNLGLLWQEHMRNETGGTKTDYRFALLSGTGALLRGPLPLLANSGSTPGFVAGRGQQPLVWDGSGWGVFTLDGLNPLDVRYYRLDADGDRVLGPVAITATAGDWELDVDATWNGSEYGVSWIRQRDATWEVRFQRLQSSGTLLGSPQVLWSAPAGSSVGHTSVIWDGANWVVAWVDNGPVPEFPQAVYLRKLNPDGTPAGVAKRVSSLYDPDFPPQDQVPVYDDVPVLVAKPGGGYLIYTTSFLNLTNTNEVARLEADAAGDPVGTRLVQSASDSHQSIYGRAATDGSQVLLAYHDGTAGTQEVATVLVNAAGTVVAGPSQVTSGHSAPDSDAYVASPGNPAVASLAGGFAVVWNEPLASQLYARTYDASGTLSGTRFPLSPSGATGRPTAVGLGSGFAVSWRDATNQVRFARYDATGALLGSEQVVTPATGGGTNAALDWSGEQYGVAWNHGGSVRLQRLLSSGLELGTESTLGGSVQGPGPALRWVGSGWALVWRSGGNLFFGRVSPTGSTAVAPLQLTTSGGVANQFQLHWNGDRLGLAWVEQRAGDPPGQDVYFTVLDADGVKQFAEVVVAGSNWADTQPSVYWTGTQFAVVHAYGQGWLRETLVSPTGTLGASRLLSNRAGQSAVASDGATAGLAWAHSGELHFQTTACLADATPASCPSPSASYDGQKISLAWTAAADAESGVQAYQVLRNGSILAEQGGSTLALEDRGFSPLTSYTYEVRPLNGAYLAPASCPAVQQASILADLSVVKSDGLGTATPGATVTYTIAASNAGPDPAAGAVVADTPPLSLIAATWTCAPSGGASCTAGPVTGPINDGVDLPAGSTATYTLTALVRPSARGTLVNTASIALPAGVSDPDAGDRSSTDSNTLTPLADVRVTQTDAADPIGPYGNVTWTVNVSNLGPSTSTGLALTDTLPGNATLVSSTPGFPTCLQTGSLVDCDLGGLGVGLSTSIQVTAGANPGFVGTLTNSATVAGAESDPVPANDTSTEDTRVVFVKGDMNLDVGTDLLFRLSTTGQNDAWLMSGTTRLGSPVTISPTPPSLDWIIAGTDDFDADHRNDLLLWNAVTGAGEFWLMNGTTRVGAPVPLAGALAPPWKPSAAADFDHDSRPDLVYRNFTTQKIEIWTMNGTSHAGTIIPTPDQAVAANWEIVGAQDWNADTNTDFLWYNATSGKIVLWFMDASVVRITGQFTNPANAGDNNWNVRAMGDYGIGPAGLPDTKDIVWRNANSGRIVVWHMDTAGNRTAGLFTTPMEPSPNPTEWTVVGPR